jgi:succinate dehydrogenase / fumarate reductase membrane anchor subunit
MQNRKHSSWAWFWQAVTGLALLFLVGLHMVAQHFVAQGGLRDYQQVVDYLSNPLIVVIEIAFLLSVTTHAMLGVRAILFDLGLSEKAERMVTYACALIGVVIVVYGFWLTYVIVKQGGAWAFLFR